MDNKIIKTVLVEWEKLKPFQPIELKKMSKNQLNKLKTSFKANGFKTPFYVWEDKNTQWVLDGHQRLPILKLLRDEGDSIPEKLPAIFIDCKNKKEAKKAVLIFNSHYADIQQDILADWIKDLDFEDLKIEIDIPDIDFNKIEQLLQPETNNDDEVPEDVKPITKLGDLWELGRHRVLCGDSTKIEDVERLMDGKKADMVFTSPPYNANTKTGDGDIFNGKASKKLYAEGYSDNKTSGEYIHFVKNVLEMCFMFTVGYIYWNVNYNQNSKFEYIKQIEDRLEYLIEQICWRKSSIIPYKGMLRREWEPIYLFNTNRETVGNNDVIGNVWEISNTNSQGADHKGCFPVGLPSKAIEILGDKCHRVLDPFGGSGSTLIACEKTNRIGYGMELDEHYCDVIRDRYIQWCKDNNKPYSVKLNGKSYNPEKSGIK